MNGNAIRLVFVAVVTVAAGREAAAQAPKLKIEAAREKGFAKLIGRVSFVPR